ncbi:MAG: (2Fe-2S)-binding protein [Caldiserica bacterium]|jgi:aerobic-type carbon monoxide dehydrogenase small subunit (CoxS/CutS family)|nr:(2Fe-2S)-binding protein [Caldisericota bacterium]MDH7562672.1 (2Fe-2S)-binding protein [Caldisericota bacterium]
MIVNFTLNGKQVSYKVHPGESLFEVLRKEGNFEVKGDNCRDGSCGACTVLLDGVPVPSCTILIGKVEGREVETVKTLGEAPNLHPIQRAFLEKGGVQCGYCTPGMLLVVKALLSRNPDPTPEEIREELSGNICRCTGYIQQIESVERAVEILRGEVDEKL